MPLLCLYQEPMSSIFFLGKEIKIVINLILSHYVDYMLDYEKLVLIKKKKKKEKFQNFISLQYFWCVGLKKQKKSHPNKLEIA